MGDGAPGSLGEQLTLCLLTVSSAPTAEASASRKAFQNSCIWKTNTAGTPTVCPLGPASTRETTLALNLLAPALVSSQEEENP